MSATLFPRNDFYMPSDGFVYSAVEDSPHTAASMCHTWYIYYITAEN